MKSMNFQIYRYDISDINIYELNSLVRRALRHAQGFSEKLYQISQL